MKHFKQIQLAFIISMAGLMGTGCGSKAEANGDEAEKVEPAIPVETQELAQAEALLRQFEADFKRNKELFSKNLVSADIYEKSQFAYEGQKAAWKLARINKGYTTLRAPFAGVVAERAVKVGNMVAIYDPTFRIIDHTALKATLYVPEIELGKLQVGQPASVKLDALPDHDFKGELRLISPVVDPASGTVKVTVAIDNSDGILKPGMFGRVEIMHEIHSNVLLLPKDAVLAEDKETNVFVVADTLALRRRVTLGLINSLNYEIIDGLLQGDLVITTGQAGLRDSTRIIVVGN